MKIYLAKKENLYSFMRECGYAPFKESYVRTLTAHGFPRFHIYVNETEDQYILNLHLDQKKPSYGKETAHSGEYDGAIVEQEAVKIKSLIKI